MTASPRFPKLPQGWSEKSTFIAGPMGTESLFFRTLQRTDSVRRGRCLYIVHGFGEQSDRFMHFPHYLHTSIDCIGLIDLPGHGKSLGARGHIEDFAIYATAALAGFQHFKQQMQTEFPGNQYHWFGASMGGLTTLFTLLRETQLPLKSVIVTEPQLGIAVEVPWWKEQLGRLIEPVLGRLAMNNEIKLQDLSADESVQETYQTNPLNHSRVTPRTFMQMQKAMHEVNTTTQEFAYPLLMLVPLADRVVSWKASLQFFKNLRMKGSAKKSLQTFANFNHEAFNEIGKERAFVALEDWLRSF